MIQFLKQRRELMRIIEDVSGTFAAGRMEGVVYACTVCRTLLRPGQGHTAMFPEPHQTFEMLIRDATPAEMRAQAELLG